MVTGSLRRQHIKDNVFRYVSAVFRWIIEPPASMDEKQRRRVMLLSAFLLLFAINTLIGAMAVKNAGGSSWPIMVATAAILAVGYVLSRTGYYRLATVIAVSAPAVPIIAMILFSPNREDIPNQLTWLALPLLVCSLLLSMRYTIIIAIVYIAFIVLLIPFVDVPVVNLSDSLAFMFMIFLFVVAVTAVRQHDQSEIERQLTERKKTEDTLRESEEKFSTAFRSSPEMIIIVNLRTGKYIEVNDSFASITGYTREELIGHVGEEFNLWVNPEEEEKMGRLLAEQGKVTNEEFSFRMKSGEIRTWLCSVGFINIGGDSCMLAVATDITGRKRAEQALRESEEKFSVAFRSSPEAFFITRLKDDIIIEINESFTHFTGYTREEVIGHVGDELNLWVYEEERTRMLQVVQEQGRVYKQEIHSRMKSGEIRVGLFSAELINIGGEPCMIFSITDITERKKAEEALRESEEKFSKAFNASPETIAITTFKDGVFLEVNDSFTRLTGYTHEEVIGRSSTDLNIWVNTEDRVRMLQLLKKNGKVDTEEWEFRMKSGEIRNWLFSGEKINIDGKPCIISITTDITERKQAEEKLKQAMSELEQSSARLAATNKELETFSYSVSHDLRSPLRSIDGFSQALLEDYGDKLDKNGQDYLKRLRGASQKMGELIDGLLKLSRLTRSKMHEESVDLSILAEDIAARLQETQPKRRAKFIIDKGLTASGDPLLLRVLIENLLGNAWKFTGKSPHAKIEFGATRNNGKETYFVKDNGAGFDMTYADKLFGAFQRLHDTTEFPGTGIGLATVQRIINRHGGTIQAEGAVGKGATFYFTLE